MSVNTGLAPEAAALDAPSLDPGRDVETGSFDPVAFATGERHEFKRSRELQARAHDAIPGGCHTLAKGDDQFPVLAPGFIVRGHGSHVWDADGNEYIEYGMGCRAVTLGHGFEPVVEAVRRELAHGCNFGRPAPIEVECAEAFLACVPQADMCKFSKDGSTATTAAIKLARAHTGRDRIALCGDHPFFSIHDWFIGTTAIDRGIPDAVKGLTSTFRYNDLASLRALFERHPNEIAAVILEPAKYDEPQDGFLHAARDLAHAHGALFILDEMITGFRWAAGGAQSVYDITPDLSTFGKALANGFSVSALAGRRELMELAGLRTQEERVFLMSTTHGAETHALAAAIATMRIYAQEPVVETLRARGERLRGGIEAAAVRHGVEDHVKVVGPPQCMVLVHLDRDGNSSQAMRTLMMQEQIRHGVIAPSLVTSYSHSVDDIDATVEAMDRALAVYARGLADGPERHLVGRPTRVVYRKHN